MVYGNSCEEVLKTEDLLGEIIQRSRGSKTFLKASHVNKSWRLTARIPSVIHGFTTRNMLCFIGFIFEHARSVAPDISLITPDNSSNDDSARELRERFVADGLYGKHVLGTFNGRVICRVESGTKKGKLFICCPYSSRPRLFTKVGPQIYPMEKISGVSTYGRFAVLEPTDGPVSGFPVVFVKDNSTDYRTDHLGVYFKPAGRICVHVCVLKKGVWIPYSSEPLTLASPCMFQRTPYCVQAGRRIYLMYLVGIIVCFDVLSGSFTNVPLPGLMGTTVKGCLQYTAGPHPKGDLAIVNLEKGRFAKWVLSHNGETVGWHLERRVDLIAALGDYMNEHIFRAYSFDPKEWCSFQVRYVSPDGRYVLLSVGVMHGLFVVDMLYVSAVLVPDLEKMGRVFPLSVYWPSKA